MGQVLRDAVRSYAEPFDESFGETTYRTEWVDLNGDDRDDALVFLEGAAWCGSSGCTLLVMVGTAPEDAAEVGAFAPAAEISLMHAPVYVSTTTTEGWHDLIVEDGQGTWRRLRFDGETYPFSPAGGDSETAPPVDGLVAFAPAAR